MYTHLVSFALYNPLILSFALLSQIMRTIIPNSSSSSSSSKRNFKWAMQRNGSKNGVQYDPTIKKQWKKEKEDKEKDILSSLSFSSSSSFRSPSSVTVVAVPIAQKKVPRAATTTVVSKFRLAVTSALINARRHGRLGKKGSHVIIGTLYGHKRGHVHLAFQDNTKLHPFVLLELAMTTNNLVQEMASGLVRVALECVSKVKEPKRKLLEENLWLAYCNGRKCGYAIGRECGPSDWKVLEAIGPVTMGAGVIPKGGEEEGDGEVMYMRARFERIIGSGDSEAFYMMSPDGKGGTELSVFFLRV